MKTVRPFRLNWPKRVAQSGDVEKPLDGPGNSGFVALASFQQPKSFETRHLPRFDLDGDQQTTASAPLSTGVETFPCTLSALLIREECVRAIRQTYAGPLTIEGPEPSL
jgi:hypothetical protein